MIRAGCVAAGLAAASGCGLTRPSCIDEDLTFFEVGGHSARTSGAAYTIVSPKNSNLVIRLTWPDLAATLDLRATIIDCGGHVGCVMSTLTPSVGPGGPSASPQPWPPGLRELVVDGWRGKTYRVEITTEEEREVSFTLKVTSHIACET